MTGAGGPAGVNVIKLLRDEYYVVSTDMSGYSEGFALSHRYYVVPSASEAARFLRALEDIVEAEGVDLIIPTVDEEIFVLANNGLRHGDRLVSHPRETVNTCINKYEMYRYLERRVPELIPRYSKDPRDLDSDPVVKKPVVGRGSRNIYVGRRGELSAEEGYFFVEYLPGREWTVDAAAGRDGSILVAVPRVRLKTRAGVSQVGRVIMNRELIGYVVELARHLRFSGGLNVQFKEDAAGRPKLQEINLRFSGGLDITAKAGVNLPKLLVEHWLHGTAPSGLSVREGVYVRVPEAYYWEDYHSGP